MFAIFNRLLGRRCEVIRDVNGHAIVRRLEKFGFGLSEKKLGFDIEAHLCAKRICSEAHRRPTCHLGSNQESKLVF